jgi:hypothetical protein
MDAEIKAMRDKIDDLGRRIAERERQLREAGAFTDAHAAALVRLRAAHAALLGRVSEEPRRHWLGIRDELSRDYGALLDDVERAGEQADAAEIKSSRAT